MAEGPSSLPAVGWGLPVPHNVHFSIGLLGNMGAVPRSEQSEDRERESTLRSGATVFL